MVVIGTVVVDLSCCAHLLRRQNNEPSFQTPKRTRRERYFQIFIRKDKEKARQFLDKLPCRGRERIAFVVESKDNLSTLLHFAVKNGWKDICEFLVLECNFDVECRDGTGMSPFHYACQSKDINLVLFFV